MKHRLTLAHSPDPDDVFMWWPLTGKIVPEGAGFRRIAPPTLPGLVPSRFAFDPLPTDIEALNRRAVADDDTARLDITALSLRCWADVRDRFLLTRCGGSFGDGFGPKLVVPASHPAQAAGNLRPNERIAVPGFRTTAYMMLTMVLGIPGTPDPGRFVEMPFDQIIPAVASGRVDAGLVIHEGQLTFADAGLRLLIDVGAWWKDRTGLKLPLGVNAVRNDLDTRFGPGSMREVADLLAASVRYAVERREESTAYTMPWAKANADKAGMAPPTLERVDRYCRMYVSEETVDMTVGGENSGLTAIRWLLGDALRVATAEIVPV
jgi:1,4-dihydroxy-6-naphthoate synthase